MDCSDRFLNIAELRVLDWGRLTHTDRPHGLLGQSWTRRSRAVQSGKDGQVSVREVVEGEVDEYVIAEDELFGTSFVYSAFEANKQPGRD